MLTYGDGVADVDIAKLLDFHRAHGKLATITAVQPLGRFGALQIDEDRAVDSLAPAVRAFQEKPVGDGAWVNGGFFVLEPAVLDRIEGDDTPFERRAAREPGRRRRAAGLSAIAASGSRWTPCATCVRSRRCGTPARRRGRSGGAMDAGGVPMSLRRGLRGPARLRHRPHRVQGGVARRVAAAARRRGHRLRARAADRAQPVRRARAWAAAARHVVADVRDRGPPGGRGAGRAAVGRLPPGRPGARPARVRASRTRPSRPTSWAPSTCSRRPVPAPRSARSSSSPATSATRTARRTAPSARRTPWAAAIRTAPARAAPSWSPPPTATASSPTGAAVASARAGNVIGGGDWAADRIIPDCVRALAAGEPDRRAQPRCRAALAARARAALRLPLAGRPRCCATAADYDGAWNFGPDRTRPATSRCAGWWSASSKSGAPGSGPRRPMPARQPHEARRLSLDSTKAREQLGWAPVWDAADRGAPDGRLVPRVLPAPPRRPASWSKISSAPTRTTPARAGLPWAAADAGR